VPPGFLPDGRRARRLEALGGLAEAYSSLAESLGEANAAVAVRSSAVDEDGHAASFAGQHETFLNVRGLTALEEAVQACWASVERLGRASTGEPTELPTEAPLAVLRAVARQRGGMRRWCSAPTR